MKNTMKGLKKTTETKVVFPPLKGMIKKGGIEFTLVLNTKTDRYDLKENGKLVLSSSHHDCLLRAAKIPVVWEKVNAKKK